MKDLSLPQLILDLPEIYQPVFGHPELSTHVSRKCTDRLEEIIHAHDALSSLLGRPVRILDLGCAQGFFSLSLADRGAIVCGVDFSEKNIAACKALAAEHPSYKVDFEVDRVENIVKQLKTEQYDLVLGLSVFHHLVYEHGVAKVRELLDCVAVHTGALIVEFAQHTEPLYWAQAQPQDTHTLLEGYAFVHGLAQHETHLSDIRRPLYFASSRFWYLSGQAGAIEKWETVSNVLAQGTHQGTRRYYFCGKQLVKMYRLDNPDRCKPNLEEHRNEVEFLRSLPVGFDGPKLMLHGENDNEAWLVRECISGELLIDIIREGKPYNSDAILKDILFQLVTLETAGLYHNDVRVWNVLVSSESRANLIDYGAISKEKNDCVWPYNIFLSFLIFLREVLEGKVKNPVPLRAPWLNPYALPKPYRDAVLALREVPLSDWSFSLFRDNLSHTENESRNGITTIQTGLTVILQAMEEAANLYQGEIVQLHNRAEQAETERRGMEAEARAVKAEAESRAMEAEVRAIKAESEARVIVAEARLAKAEAERRGMEAEARAVKAEAESRAMEAEVRAIKAESEVRVMESEARTVKAEASVLVAEAEARTLSIETVASIAGMEARALQAEIHVRAITAEAEIRANELKAALDATSKELHEVHQANHHHWQQLEATGKELHAVHQANHHHWQLSEARQAQIQEILGSTSWRITAPLRWLGSALLWTSPSPKTIKPKVKVLLQQSALYIARRPRLKKTAIAILNHTPALKSRLLNVVQVSAPLPVPAPQHDNATTDSSKLTPHARRIYADLKSAIERRQKENR